MRTLSRRRRVLAAAVGSLLAAGPMARASGLWDGEGNPTNWNDPVNWTGNTLPTPADPITFNMNGEPVGIGAIIWGGVEAHPSLTFGDWSNYFLGNAGDTFSFSGATPSLNVGASLPGVWNGSNYFGAGTVIGANLVLPAGSNTTLGFNYPDVGSIELQGSLSGTGNLALTRAGTGVRAVYFRDPSPGYSGTVTVNDGTVVRLLNNAQTGTGPINFHYGEVDILSEVAQNVANPMQVAYGIIGANHNFTDFISPAYTPGTTHTLGPIVMDNPTNLGGSNDSVLEVGSSNGYNYKSPSLMLGNTQLPPAAAGLRAIQVNNLYRSDGFRGNIRLTSPNRLQEPVTTLTFGSPGPAASLVDLDPVTLTGIPLIKYGSGVLAFDGNNTASSSGIKYVNEGVLRFKNPQAYGLTGGSPSPVEMYNVPGGAPVSAAMGVAYDPFGPVPANLSTTGTIPGQSGAYDIDRLGYGSLVNPSIISLTAPFPATALRVGSSSTGSITGAIVPYNDFGLGTTTYYFGGGGGTVTMAAPWAVGAFAPFTVEMGTSGQLLPGRLNITSPLPGGAGKVNIRAGTLDASTPFVLNNGTGTSVGAYSTSLGSDGVYSGAPAATPFNGPGQLLLDATTQAGAGYNYFPFGGFGAVGVTLDGGAVGWGPTLGPAPAIIPVNTPPGTYGTTISSTLYSSLSVLAASIPTNILHLGGENSTGTMLINFPINNNGGTPVAFIKSGADSIVDLRPPGVNGYSGGTDIIGGEVQVDNGGQLGGFFGGAVVIGDGGILHIMASGGPVQIYPQVLRVANGPGARSSRINVDPGVTAQFSFNYLEASTAGSLLEKTGQGSLELLPPGLYPIGPNNQDTWGIKVSDGTVTINQLPRSSVAGSMTGAVVFSTETGGGPIKTLRLVGPGNPGFIAIPPATKYSPDYGFAGIEDLAYGTIHIDDGAFFRITGRQATNFMELVTVEMGPTSVFKIAGDASGKDTSGIAQVVFNGGNVQFTPGGGKILWPRSAGFTTSLYNGAQFSGCPDADVNGFLAFNTLNPAGTVTIDAATVDNVPNVVNSTWTWGGTGGIAWAGLVKKGSTEAIPGGGGPFVTGVININRNLGAPISVLPGAVLDIEAGTINAGGTADPFEDHVTPSTHIGVIDNANFNITQALKHVQYIVGTGTTTVSAGATLLVGSDGPVFQNNFNVNGAGDVGDVNVTFITGIGPGGALAAHYVRGGTLGIAGNLLIKDNGNVGGVSRVNTLTISAGGHLDLRDNHLIVTTAGSTGTYNGTNYTAVTGLIASGRNGNILPLWDGATGIITTLPAATGSNYTTIGVAKASDVRPATSTTTALWAGQTITGTDTLVMYTYGGDATLDGKINVDDYIRIDSGIAAGLTGWSNGDFNYDGKVNIDDYTGFIDANIGTQGAPFPTSSGGPALAGAISAVPEPLGAASVAALILPSLAVSRRRRRQRR